MQQAWIARCDVAGPDPRYEGHTVLLSSFALLSSRRFVVAPPRGPRALPVTLTDDVQGLKAIRMPGGEERMRATGRIAMEMLPQNPQRNSRAHRYFAMGMSFLFALFLSGTAWAQQATVSGTVTGSGGIPLRGVTVRIQGTDTRAFTDASGKYTITAPTDAVLAFSALGRRPAQAGVLGRSTVNVTLDPVAFLEEITVTGYTEQRRADITTRP